MEYILIQHEGSTYEVAKSNTEKEGVKVFEVVKDSKESTLKEAQMTLALIKEENFVSDAVLKEIEANKKGEKPYDRAYVTALKLFLDESVDVEEQYNLAVEQIAFYDAQESNFYYPQELIERMKLPYKGFLDAYQFVSSLERKEEKKEKVS